MAGSQTRLLIHGCHVYDHEGDVDAPSVADILIEGSKIARIGTDIAAELKQHGNGIKTIDGKDKIAIPGFVSAHYHSHDVLLKGSFETIPLDAWLLLATPPAYAPPSDEEVRARTLIGAAESIRGGITTVQDLLTIWPLLDSHVDTVVRSYKEIGLRTVFALQIADIPGLEAFYLWKKALPPEFHQYLNSSAEPLKDRKPLEVAMYHYARLKDFSPLLTWALGPNAPETCSPGLMEGVAAMSARHDLRVFTHFNPHRMSAQNNRFRAKGHNGSIIRYMKDLGFLTPRVGLAHSVWISQEDIEVLAETGAGVVLNPVGNLKTKAGVPPIREYLAAGVPIALGCDNCSCSDVQNMFQAMKQFTCLPAVSHIETGPPTAAQTMQIATVGGARAVGLEARVGALKPNMQADITLLDLTHPCFVPLNSAARQLVFSESGSSVETVIIDGRVVMQDRKLVTVNEAEIRDAVKVVMDSVRVHRDKRADLIKKMQPYLDEATRESWALSLGMPHRYVGERVL
jgi:guanine deaminase